MRSRVLLLGALAAMANIGPMIFVSNAFAGTSTPTVREPFKGRQRSRPSYRGQTPEQAQAALSAAQAKRDRRIERNYRNEAAQGRQPDDLELVDGVWTAWCRSCSKPYAFEGEVGQFAFDVNFCGRNQWCTP